ncbi:MAG: two-component system response regulator [Brevundimonas sp.]|jgi:CheY-like chemotaxis protein|uniref:response regulator n=1 Tax=Brevundimonas sp. TaxID=1871086 RepID=UPI00391BF8B2
MSHVLDLEGPGPQAPRDHAWLGPAFASRLSLIEGFAELLRHPGPGESLSARQSLALSHILTTARDLSRLIGAADDLADPPLSLPTDIGLLSSRLLEEYGDEARGRAVRWLMAPAPRGLVCMTDPGRLSRLLSGLLGHLARNVPAGGRVSASVASRAGHACLTLEIEGCTLGQARLERLAGDEPPMDPMALALFVAMRLARRLGLELCHERVHALRAGEILRVSLSVPLAPGAALAPASSAPAAARPDAVPVVLYADDSAAGIALVRHVLSTLPPVCLHVARSAREALSLAEGLEPDLVIASTDLPDAPARQLKTDLRAHPLTRHLSLILLGRAPGIGEPAGPGRGFTLHLSRPLDVTTLRASIETGLRRGVRARADHP